MGWRVRGRGGSKRVYPLGNRGMGTSIYVEPGQMPSECVFFDYLCIILAYQAL